MFCSPAAWAWRAAMWLASSPEAWGASGWAGVSPGRPEEGRGRDAAQWPSRRSERRPGCAPVPVRGTRRAHAPVRRPGQPGWPRWPMAWWGRWRASWEPRWCLQRAAEWWRTQGAVV
jgi:hypothetical protein